jgi:hypothetical protein
VSVRQDLRTFDAAFIGEVEVAAWLGPKAQAWADSVVDRAFVGPGRVLYVRVDTVFKGPRDDHQIVLAVGAVNPCSGIGGTRGQRLLLFAQRRADGVLVAAGRCGANGPTRDRADAQAQVDSLLAAVGDTLPRPRHP